MTGHVVGQWPARGCLVVADDRTDPARYYLVTDTACSCGAADCAHRHVVPPAYIPWLSQQPAAPVRCSCGQLLVTLRPGIGGFSVTLCAAGCGHGIVHHTVGWKQTAMNGRPGRRARTAGRYL